MKIKTGVQKAAIAIISLGPAAASSLYRHLSEREIEQVSAEIARIGTISPDEKQEVLDEFLQMTMAQRTISQGGLELAREILDKALGRNKANEIINRVLDFGEGSSFEILRKIEPLTVANFLKKEHPQTVATILAHMDSRLMGPVLEKLPPDLQAEVSYRVATLDKQSPEVIRVIEEVLKSSLSSDVSEIARQRGGTKKVAEALNETAPDVWREILDGIEEYSKEVALEVKNQMFIFEDIAELDDKSVQELLKNIDSRELAVALKAASDAIKHKIFGNMSKRAVEGIKEDIEYMGPVRLSDVEAAQQRIVDVLRKLEEDGAVILGGTGAGAVMVE
jgi:flagellar motor switch protein FliG